MVLGLKTFVLLGTPHVSLLDAVSICAAHMHACWRHGALLISFSCAASNRANNRTTYYVYFIMCLEAHYDTFSVLHAAHHCAAKSFP